jgi:hypothetical protein
MAQAIEASTCQLRFRYVPRAQMEITMTSRGRHGWREMVRRTALALLSAGLPFVAHATEGGLTHYIPGSAATLIDTPPTKPGWVAEAAYLRYSGNASASRDIVVGGQIAAGLDATSDAVLVGGFYTFDQKVLGADYTVGAFLPYAWITAQADVATPLGTRQRRDRVSGVGDMTIIPAMLAWKADEWQYSTFLPVFAPTGQYETGRLANPGLNYWTFDPTVGASYSGAKNGLNAALYAGFSINTKNNATDYSSGTVFHLDGSVQQLLPVGPGFVGIGAEAWYLQQVSGDSGAGARLGSFKGRTSGIGPVLTYVLPLGKQTLVAELRWLPELDVKNRLDGDYLWLKVVYQI